MTSKKVITGPDVPHSHLPFSAAVESNGFVFISGQASVDKEGRIISGSFDQECRRSFENLKLVLAAAGLGLEDVVRMGCYVSKAEDLPAFNEIYAQYMTRPYPVRTTLVGCIGDVLKFEADAIAVHTSQKH